jgi:hypothetical protein
MRSIQHDLKTDGAYANNYTIQLVAWKLERPIVIHDIFDFHQIELSGQLPWSTDSPLPLHTPSVSLTVGIGCSPCTMQNTSPWESLKDIIGLSLLSNSNQRLQCPHIFFSATRQHRRPSNAGKRPGVGTAPTLNQGGQQQKQRAPRQRTRAAPIPATWQVGRCYWIQDGTSNFQAGEIQSISQRATIWRWLHNNKNSTRANNRVHREDTTLIIDQELLHFHASPF